MSFNIRDSAAVTSLRVLYITVVIRSNGGLGSSNMPAPSIHGNGYENTYGKYVFLRIPKLKIRTESNGIRIYRIHSGIVDIS